MWTFNVTRALIQAAGLRPLPDLVPKTDDVMRMIADAGLADSSTRRVRVLKVHELLAADTPKSVFIWPHRNPPDVLVSYMHFTKADFTTALGVARQAREAAEYYRAYPRDKLLPIDYARIVQCPREVLTRICDFLEIVVPPSALEDCEARFSRERVQALIANAGEKNSEWLDGDDRWYHLETGFQSRHVTDYRDGSWRELLTTEQQQIVHRELGTQLDITSAVIPGDIRAGWIRE